MAKTIKVAFTTYMQNYVNLDKNKVKQARESRDNLLKNIANFSNDNFFTLCENFNVHFGSFSRKTKCRPLDDIDLMIGISAEGATYNSNENWNEITMTASNANETQKECSEDSILNSTMVLNKFKFKLNDLNDYKNSDVNKKSEAVVLNLKSKEWSFDIVPCFHTVKENDGKDYYLIPNGNGKWKKTDPNIDKKHIEDLVEKHSGNMLDAIRLVKNWNKHAKIITLDGYVMECLLLQYFDNTDQISDDIKTNFIELLRYIEENVYYEIMDPKNIQGDLNNLSKKEKDNVSQKAGNTADKADEAINAENDGKIEKAINIWRDIFGDDFPEYK